ncbi:MAG: hypothetical protein KDK39_09590 [Leptospiraceae bacterium]|nr:hypothetical protein [Leptospiraceae bacterium]
MRYEFIFASIVLSAVDDSSLAAANGGAANLTLAMISFLWQFCGVV